MVRMSLMYFGFEDPTKTTFKDMPCMELEVDNPGMSEIYRRILLAYDLFQTQVSGWISNLPLHSKLLMVERTNVLRQSMHISPKKMSLQKKSKLSRMAQGLMNSLKTGGLRHKDERN